MEQIAALADMNSQNNEVKDYALRLRDDARSANDRLKDIASRHNITLPASLDPQHQQMHNRLSSLSGAAFDREFARTAAQLQDQAMRLYEDESQMGQNQEIRDLANSRMDPVRQLQQDARTLEQSITATAANIPPATAQPERTTQPPPAAAPVAPSEERLPRTAGELPLLALIGCASLAAAAFLRFVPRRS